MTKNPPTATTPITREQSPVKDRPRYVEAQNQILAENPEVKIATESACWRRTHAHCRKSDPLLGTICKWKQAESYASTWLLFHEVGHVKTYRTSMTRAESETAATRWCIETMRRLGFSIKRRFLNDYKIYVASCYHRARRRGLKRRIKSKILAH